MLTISPRFYDVAKEKGENLEIVFVSADKSPAEFQVSQKGGGFGWLWPVFTGEACAQL